MTNIFRVTALALARSAIPLAACAESVPRSWSIKRFVKFDQSLMQAEVFASNGAELFIGCRFSNSKLEAFLGLPEKNQTLSDRGVSNIAFRMDDDDLISSDAFSGTAGDKFYEITFLPPEALGKLLSLTQASFEISLQDSQKRTVSAITFDVRGASQAIAEVRAGCGIPRAPFRD